MELFIKFYRETFKREIIQPIQVFLTEINTPLELIKTIVYLSAVVFFLGINLPRWSIMILGTALGIVSWIGGKFLIKHRIPHAQNEITNDLNPQMVLLNKIAKKIL